MDLINNLNYDIMSQIAAEVRLKRVEIKQHTLRECLVMEISLIPETMRCMGQAEFDIDWWLPENIEPSGCGVVDTLIDCLGFECPDMSHWDPLHE